MSDVFRSAVAATSFLTRIPVARVIRVEGADVARSAWMFPIVGAVVGGASGLAANAVGRDVPALAAGAVAVAAAALLTGAMHLDALADSADALGATTRERALEIMRDPRLGTYGVTALVSVLVVDAAIFGELSRTHDAALAGLAAGAAGRAALLVPASALPYARAEPGRGSVVEGLRRPAVVTAFLVSVPLVLPERGAGLLSLCGALFVAVALTWFFRRMFGGMTGDLLGATAKLAETAALAILLIT